MKFEYSSEELAHAERIPDAHRAGVGPVRGGKPASGCWGKAAVVVLLVAAVAGGAWYALQRTGGGSAARDDGGAAVADGQGASSASDSGAKDVSVQSARDYLTPTLAEINQLFNYVIESPFVRKNPVYYQALVKLPFRYLATNDTVNASARRRVVEKGGKTSAEFSTVFYGGAARYARLVGLAYALEDSGRKGALRRFVEKMPGRICAACSEKAALAMIEDGGLVGVLADTALRQKAISFSSGTIAYIIAHEMGHHALGHMTGLYEKENLEIRRNQEREADSFASSVISSSSFGEYVFAGTLFWSYARAMQTDGDSDQRSTHPLWRERLENFVRANREKAAALGISVK